MQERVSSEEARERLAEYSAIWGDPDENGECRELLDLLDARKRIEELESVTDLHALTIVMQEQQRLHKERDEARPVLEAAREHERDHRGEYVMNEKVELVFVRHGVHCEVCKAIRAYGAARAAGEER